MKNPLLLLLLLASACPAVDPPLDDDDTTAAPEAPEDLPSAILDAFSAEADGVGASLAVYHRGHLYAGSVGTKDPEGGDPIEPTTLFRIGSTTKMMTATAVLHAEDEGVLSVGDPVVDYLPGLSLQGVAPFEDVTLHHLMSHTSGIREITPIDGGADDARLHDFTYSGFASTSYMMAPAGAFWNYSNPNFSLAGAAVEAADGRAYRDIIEEDVWAPLGMDRSYFLGSEVEADGDFAWADTTDWTGQSTDPLRVGPASYDDAWSRPAGFAWSSSLDLVRWGRFLIDGSTDVLSDSAHGELIAPQADMHAYLDLAHYGYGVIEWTGTRAGGAWYPLDTVQHNGAIPGYSAEIVTVPAEDLVVVTLAAADGAYFTDTLKAVIDELLDVAPTDLPDPGIAGDDLSRYVGTYEDPSNVGTVIVTQADDGHLRWSMPRLDQLSIPYGEDLQETSLGNFRVSLQGGDTSVSFLTEDGTDLGPTRWLRHRAFVAARAAQ